MGEYKPYAITSFSYEKVAEILKDYVNREYKLPEKAFNPKISINGNIIDLYFNWEPKE